MRTLLVVTVALGMVGCASSEAAKKAAAAPLPWCDPCTQPCTPPCGQPEVVAKPVAAPAPAPAPTPPPPPPSPAASPTFSPAPGTYEGAQSVAISCSDRGAVPHYTTDGSTPTASSPRYGDPVHVEKGTTIRAICVASHKPESAVAEGHYAIQPPKRVVVTEKKLELKEMVFFDTGKTTIKPESYSLLDEVAQTLKDHPEVKHVSIEGHTDNVGSSKTNTRLSKGRAEAVRAYLVKKGVPAATLDAKGYGPSKPIADNKTPEGREKNRRVEFMIK